MVEEEVIASQLEALLTPAITAQENYYRQLGLRDRILNLPLMVAAVLTLLWRDVAGVRELTRMLAREGFLWCTPKQVSQQAISQRFLTFPASLFEKVFKDLLPQLKAAWHARNSRPIPESVQFTLSKFERVWIVDCSTLEALFRKLGSLENAPKGQLAGKMGTVIDLMTRLPIEIWFQSNPRASDTLFEEDILNRVTAKTLLVLDRGFYHFRFWLKLIEQEVDFITRLKKGASIQVEQVFTDSYALRDRIIRLGSGTKKTPFVTLRLIEVRSGKTWHSYLTSVLDPTMLPPYVVADLYRRRWRIEDAFNTVKRLLGLSYLWTGSLNGIQLQIWGTWLFYAVLVDLGDAVADELSLPFDSISLEMIYRGLYHFSVAHQKGKATDPVKYFAAPENQDLGIVKQPRKPFVKLIVAPFPEIQRSFDHFFFQASSQIPLTTGIQP
ncbi:MULTISPECIES: IS4 family transposase [unclassified Coleofasciculus]|uniref:IS4 family transposase n=1 Tax=unclassified Coleofasciculus TaxID=2692782 RepID=UPI00187F8A46|nr:MULTISPECIES: IS4 family transposase [unclassified Coleofasciculus]MBE9130189.1 IS4 family transposase [Coleofasciculus sp. LEGE 07081]MBE9151047.1 IS4 family transposase [Coleofasciculus sp. LEGE 07092]